MSAGLTLPETEPGAMRRVYLRFLKKLCRDLLELSPSVLSELSHQRALTDVLRVAVGIAKRRPKALMSLVARPHVHVLLTTAWAAIDAGQLEVARPRITALAGQLAFEAASEGLLPPGVTLELDIGAVELVAAGAHRQVAAPKGQGSVCLSNDGASVGDGPLVLFSGASSQTAPAPGFAPVCDAATMCLVDNNPISDFEAHPDKEGNAVDLGDAPVERWIESLRAAFEIVGRGLPGVRAEMAWMLRQLFPVGTNDRQHLSASYLESIGTIYLSLHPSAMTMAEALIHENQHNKLNAALHTEPMLQNAFWPLVSSPVRPDPRPLHGVLLAAHAFVPVARLYSNLLRTADPQTLEPGFERRHRAIIATNTEALETLREHAEPTASGRALMADLEKLHARDARL